MKKILLLPVSLLAVIFSASAQTISNPSVENTDANNCRIVKVETTPKYTVVSFEETSAQENGWARIAKETFVQTNVSDKHYHFIKAEGIAIAPEKTTIENAGDKLSFKVYFERIPSTAKKIDVIEKAGVHDYFNFYNVSLTESQGKVTTVVLSPPPPAPNSSIGFTGDNMSNMMNAMGPVFGNMTKSIMDAQLEYYKQPEKLTEVAKLQKQYFDALVKEGFTEDQALKILTSDSLLPKANMGGK